MSSTITIRSATVSDAASLLAIYAPYVKETAITFEYTVPPLEDFEGRIRSTLQRFPYLIAEKDGQIVGYAYLGYFNIRAAYDHSAETSIYVKKDERHGGIGGKLYHAIEEAANAMHIYNLNACIGYPADDKTEDPYLSLNSPEFHAHLGYTLVGRFHKCGYKFGRWYDMIWMEKMLSQHTDKPAPFIPYPELKR
jgi:L-amino acid N-acyltransferase YncA